MTMRTIKIARTRVSKRALKEATDVLRGGGVVVFPTETSYGLAADPSNPKAVRCVYAIKERSRRKPLPFIASSWQAVEKMFTLRGKARALALRYWPGPLTLVLSFKKGRKTGAVRVPSSAWARAIAHAAGGLVTSTSANISGESAVYNSRGIARSFAGRDRTPDLFLNAGVLPKRRASTIVRVKNDTIEVLRV